MKIVVSLLLVLGICASIPAAESKTASKKAASSKTAEKSSAKKEGEKNPSGESVKLADSLTEAQSKKLLSILNEGDDKALASLPGVGKTRAAAIKKARPFKDVAAATLVGGVGEGTLKEWVAHAKAGFPTSDSKPAAEKSSAKGKKKAKTTKTKE